MSEPYRRYRTFYQDVSGSLNVAAATDDTTLVTGKASHKIYIQKIHIEITGSSASKTWSFEDSNASAVSIVPSVATDNIAHFDFDFGPQGVPCTEAKNFLLNVSAAGASGWVTWEGYLKPSSTLVA